MHFLGVWPRNAIHVGVFWSFPGSAYTPAIHLRPSAPLASWKSAPPTEAVEATTRPERLTTRLLPGYHARFWWAHILKKLEIWMFWIRIWMYLDVLYHCILLCFDVYVAYPYPFSSLSSQKCWGIQTWAVCNTDCHVCRAGRSCPVTPPCKIIIGVHESVHIPQQCVQEGSLFQQKHAKFGLPLFSKSLYQRDGLNRLNNRIKIKSKKNSLSTLPVHLESLRDIDADRWW